MKYIPVTFMSTFDMKVAVEYGLLDKVASLVDEAGQKYGVCSAEVSAQYDEEGPDYGSLFIHFFDRDGNFVSSEEIASF